jgi:hypothetical protein
MNTRVGTKVFVFVFSWKFSRKLNFRFREIFVKKIRNFRESFRETFRENSEMKRHYNIYEVKFFFLLFTSKKSAYYNFFVMPKQFLKILKRQCHEIYAPRFLKSNSTPWVPASQAKAFWNSASNSPRYDRFSHAKIVHAVKIFCYVAPLNLYIFCGGAGQFGNMHHAWDVNDTACILKNLNIFAN